MKPAASVPSRASTSSPTSEPTSSPPYGRKSVLEPGPVDLSDEREQHGVPARDRRAELAHVLVGDSPVERGEPRAAGEADERTRDGHGERKPEQEPDRAAAHHAFPEPRGSCVC